MRRGDAWPDQLCVSIIIPLGPQPKLPLGSDSPEVVVLVANGFEVERKRRESVIATLKKKKNK